MAIFASNMHKYIELDVKKIKETDIKDYLRENPTHYLFNGGTQFVCNIYGKAFFINSSNEISHFVYKDKEKALTNEWYPVEPIKFIDAVKAWDCGVPVLSKSNDLYPCFILVNDDSLNRDEILFDGIDILVKQWFKFIV